MRTCAQKQNPSPKRLFSISARSDITTSPFGHRQRSTPQLDSTVMQRRLLTKEEAPEAGLTHTASPSFGHSFGQIPLHPPTASAIQTKLAINEPGDQYEQEADRVAGEVMNMREAPPSGAAIDTSSSAIQSLSVDGMHSLETETIGRNSLTATNILIQRQPANAGGRSQSSTKEEDKKAELEFRSVMEFPEFSLPLPDQREPSPIRIYPEEDRGFAIGWRVWNTGWKTAPFHHNRLTIYDAHDCSGCRRPEDVMYSEPSLGPSINSITQPGKSEYEESFWVDGLPAGHYEAYGELDVNNEVDEINEDNNTHWMVFDVKPGNKP